LKNGIPMKKTIITLLVLFSVALGVKGQKEENTSLKEYYADAEFFLAQEFYVDALHDYIEIYNRGFKDNPNINYKIGICYLNIPAQKDKAIEYLEKAKESSSLKYRESTLNEKFAPIDAYLFLGNAYRINNMVDKAIETYKTYKSLIPTEEINLQKFADKQIDACNVANDFMHNHANVEFQNLGPIINSSSDEYKAVFSGNGKRIVYMHKLPFYNAVYYSNKVDSIWDKPENITPQLMSDGDQYVCFISYDGNTILLTKEDEYNSDIYISKFVDNRWTKSEPLGSNINTKYWESHACLSKDGKLLYFTSNRKEGIGDMDIWVSKLNPDGTWGEALNLGKKINTELNEDTPFITESGKSLYFSSQGFVNMGGYDLFVSHLEGDTWSVPENMGYPFSTTDDDLFYFPSREGKSGYVSRIMTGGHGGSDIYRIGEKEELAEPITVEQGITEEPVASPKILEQPAISQNVEPQMDTVTKKEVVEQKETVVVQKPLITKEEPVITAGQPKEPKKEAVGVAQVKTIEISPVLFEFNKTSLTSIGKTVLDKIAEFMKSDLKINVLLLGYADALGPEDYNIRLSEQRALQTMNYLVQKGIDATQLKIVGKGEIDFIAPNTKADGSDYPEGRKYNRRVEFEITGIDKNTVILKRIDPVPVEMRIKN
jgi:outer membrane protein OmpA-like peptidoglycan-associated protein/Tol biopolymer transport system component